jgi:hypothetical protein
MDTNTAVIATPAKLRNGSWGARVQGAATVGQTITIQTKGGKTWDATIEAVLWSGDGVSLCSTRSASPAPRPSARYSSGLVSYERGVGMVCEECGDRVRPGSRCWETGMRH